MASPKAIVKEAINRSPDDSDTWIMRMYFEVRAKVVPEQSEARSAALAQQANNFMRNMNDFKNDSTR